MHLNIRQMQIFFFFNQFFPGRSICFSIGRRHVTYRCIGKSSSFVFFYIFYLCSIPPLFIFIVEKTCKLIHNLMCTKSTSQGSTDPVCITDVDDDATPIDLLLSGTIPYLANMPHAIYRIRLQRCTLRRSIFNGKFHNIILYIVVCSIYLT